jgi:hypothetical protein
LFLTEWRGSLGVIDNKKACPSNIRLGLKTEERFEHTGFVLQANGKEIVL